VLTIAGQDHYLGKYDSQESHQQYDRLLIEWIAEGRLRHMRRSRDLTVADLCLAFWEYRKAKRQPDGRPSGELAPFKSVIRLLRKSYGTLPVIEFRSKSLKGLRLITVRRKKWSRKNINRQICRVRHIFRWGVSEELCPLGNYRRLKTIQGLAPGELGVREKPPVKAVDEKAVEATLPHLPPVLRDVVRLQMLTGARPDEICSLRPQDVDRTRKVWQYRPAIHKNQHRDIERIVFIGPAGQKLLKRYLKRAADAFCFSPAESEEQRLREVHRRRKTPLHYGNRPGSHLQARPRKKPGLRYTAAAYRRAISRACQKANITAWSPNRLRHAMATKARGIGGIDASQAILGHASVRMSENYAHLQLEKAEAVIRKIG
jgi:integrase